MPTDRWQLGQNMAHWHWPRTSKGSEEAILEQNRLFWGPLEYWKGQFVGQSKLFQCGPSRQAVWKHFLCQPASLGHPRVSQGPKSANHKNNRFSDKKSIFGHDFSKNVRAPSVRASNNQFSTQKSLWDRKIRLDSEENGGFGISCSITNNYEK